MTFIPQNFPDQAHPHSILVLKFAARKVDNKDDPRRR
jgi:hypothetical protein